MAITILQGLGALALLFLSGEALVRGASMLALRLGVSSLAVGLTVVAFGTSMPELVVSLNAALSGANDISVGNVVGSNIANIALILGVAAMIGPLAIQSRVIRVDGPIMVAVSILLLVLISNQVLSRQEGLVLALGLVAFVVLTIRQGRTSPGHVLEEVAPVTSDERPGLLGGAVWLLAGLAVLIVAGHLLVDAAIKIAVALDVEQATIGLTIVAVGTSLPELATSAVASLRGHGDIAVGNVIGSNIFNILGILGITAFIQPLHMGGLTWIDLGVMVAVAIVSMAMLFTGKRVGRLEGIVLFASYAAYTVYLSSG